MKTTLRQGQRIDIFKIVYNPYGSTLKGKDIFKVQGWYGEIPGNRWQGCNFGRVMAHENVELNYDFYKNGLNMIIPSNMVKVGTMIVKEVKP